MVVFKAMGIECEQEIVQMVGCEEEVISTFAPSLEECHRLNVYTQLQVILQSKTLNVVKNTYGQNRGVNNLSCIMGNQGKMAGNLKVYMKTQS